MKIRTKEALRTIRTKETALNEREYAGNRLQGNEQKMIRTAVSGADRVGRWGIRQTKKGIDRYRKQKAERRARRAAKATVKTVQAAVKATAAALRSIAAGTKLTVSLIAAGGWVAVLVILLICAVILVAGTIEDFLPGVGII